MNSMAPDLSGLVPYLIAFIAVASVGAVASLAIIAHAAATVVAERRTRTARPDNVLAQGQFISGTVSERVAQFTEVSGTR